MKKTILVIIAIVLVIGGGVWWWKSSNDNKKSGQTTNNTSNYQAEKSATNTTNQNLNTNGTNTANKTNTTNTENNTNIANATNTTNSANQVTVPKKETEIAQFSTKIHNKDPERQNNITITCKTLSTNEVAPGETFSFCSTVGKATTSKGYQEADIYVDGEKQQGLGGGNCQVSTTLYNAVLKVPELEVVERHQHSGNVPYIEKGKDAAVAYGAYDFKFKNNTNNVVKIVMENTPDNITAKLIKIG